MTKEAELGIGKDRRRVDINEEYYRLAAKVNFRYCRWEAFENWIEEQDLENWDNKRVKRLPGENDGIWCTIVTSKLRVLYQPTWNSGYDSIQFSSNTLLTELLFRPQIWRHNSVSTQASLQKRDQYGSSGFRHVRPDSQRLAKTMGSLTSVAPISLWLPPTSHTVPQTFWYISGMRLLQYIFCSDCPILSKDGPILDKRLRKRTTPCL